MCQFATTFIHLTARKRVQKISEGQRASVELVSTEEAVQIYERTKERFRHAYEELAK